MKPEHRRTMRRKDRLISEDEALSIMEKGEYGILSTVSSENEPYGVPLNYCLIGGTIYFHCAPEGQKIDNIKNNPMVSFCVVGRTQIQPDTFTTRFESAIVQGTAEEVFDEEKQMALEGFIEKYSRAFLAEGKKYSNRMHAETKVIKIVPVSVSGKANRK